MASAGSIEQTFDEGVRRLTLPMPTGPKHVHCYLLRGNDGWTLVDTGLGLGDWPELPFGIDRIFVTHMHPDHVGGAERASAATGAAVHQGRLDYAQCERVWGSDDWPQRIANWFARNGVPDEVLRDLLDEGHVYASFIKFAWNPEPLEGGDTIDGWDVVAMPGHADGHLCLFRNGVLIAGDHLLARISPAIGLYPESRPDPLADYLESLQRTIELDPRIAYGGHGEPVERPAERARELIEHHRRRLDATVAALDREPRSGYEVSRSLFSDALTPTQRRFAVAETLSHLERLLAEGAAGRTGDRGTILYTGA
jgi:glyoxylase-like metal-dependent hydrolase (beta-lactamase superfamily II)